jgi:hypothetical protein
LPFGQRQGDEVDFKELVDPSAEQDPLRTSKSHFRRVVKLDRPAVFRGEQVPTAKSIVRRRANREEPENDSR